MLKAPTRPSNKLPNPATGKPLACGYCETVREVYEGLNRSSLGQFTLPRIDAFCQDLNAVLYELERLEEASFRELIEVILRLREARNELRLARFLFDVEEIYPVYRLILRNRAVLRGKDLLHHVVQLWVLQSSPEIPSKSVSKERL